MYCPVCRFPLQRRTGSRSKNKYHIQAYSAGAVAARAGNGGILAYIQNLSINSGVTVQSYSKIVAIILLVKSISRDTIFLALVCLRERQSKFGLSRRI